MLVLDTSVVVPFYIPEAHSHRVQRLFASGSTLAISPLVEVEFTSAIARLVRTEVIAVGDGRRVLDEFQSHIQQKLYAFSPMLRAEKKGRQARLFGQSWVPLPLARPVWCAPR